MIYSVKRIERQATNWKKIYENHISNKELLSRYRKYTQILRIYRFKIVILKIFLRLYSIDINPVWKKS